MLSLKSTEITKEEENYEEAVKAINSCFGGGKPNTNILDILQDSSCVQLNKNVIASFVLNELDFMPLNDG